jgi:2-oxo-4-hydroxy-4-carboxy-5-ureidoimidazoline decarboxylase
MEPWQRLDLSAPADAERLLRACCGSGRWVSRMLDRRPFGSSETLLTAAADVWWDLSADDWREAFTHHPRIGDREALARRFAPTRHLSAREQAGVSAASEDVRAGLLEGNQLYEARFGYVFIVCASGLSAASMLEQLRARLAHDPATELRIAAGEQARITALRLRELPEAVHRI